MKHILNYKTFESTAAFPWKPLYDQWKKENEEKLKGEDYSRLLFKFKEDCNKKGNWKQEWNTEFSKEMNAAQDEELGRHQLGEYGHGFNHR
jgi:hypothetical protein